MAAIDTIDSSGGTNLGAGVAAALDQLHAHRQSDRPQSVIFFTDGEGDYDPALTTAAANTGVTVYTVDLGSRSINEYSNRLRRHWRRLLPGV